jgi:hypothetical protein
VHLSVAARYSDSVPRSFTPAAAGLAVAAIAAAGLLGASSEARVTQLLCQDVGVSDRNGGNGATGGTITYWITLRNKARRPCKVQGRPWVRVPPVSYPVVVDELRVGDYGGGPGRVFVLQPQRTLRAHVLMERGYCDYRKSNAATLIVQVGWAKQSVPLSGEACLDKGATVALGPFER